MPPGTDLSFIFCPHNSTQKQQKLPLRRVHSHCPGKSALWCSFTCQDCCFHCLQAAVYAPLTSGQLGNECASVSKGDLFSADWVCSGSASFIQRILSTTLLQKGVPQASHAHLKGCLSSRRASDLNQSKRSAVFPLPEQCEVIKQSSFQMHSVAPVWALVRVRPHSLAAA